MDHFLGVPAEAWAAWGIWLQAVIIAVAAFIALTQVREARRLRLEQTRPHIVVALRIEQRMMVMLTVENVGATLARDVSVSFEPPPLLLDGELAAQRRPIPMLPPGMKLRSHMGQGFKVLANDYEGPRRFTATVNYRDARGRHLPVDTYDLDIGIFDGYAVDPKGTHELVNEIERLRSQLSKMTGPAGVLRVEQVETSRFGSIISRERSGLATAETTRHGEGFVSRVMGRLFGGDDAT